MKHVLFAFLLLIAYPSSSFSKQKPDAQLSIWMNLKVEMKDIFHPILENEKLPSIYHVERFDVLTKQLKNTSEKQKKDLTKLKKLSNKLLKAVKRQKSDQAIKDIVVLLHAHFAEIIPQEIKKH